VAARVAKLVWGSIWDPIFEEEEVSVSLSEQCFTSPPTQYRLYGRWFL